MTHWTERPASQWKRDLLASPEFQAGRREGAAAAREVLREVRAGLRSPEDGERLDDYVQAFAEDVAAVAPPARGLRGSAADAYRLGAIDGAESVTENLTSSGTQKAGGAVAKLTGEAKRKFLAKMAAGRITGRAVKPRKKPRGKRAGSTGLARTGGSKLGTGTPAVRLSRVEHAVRDLAKVNHAVVSKLVDHEKRLVKVESAARSWASGRRK